MRTSIPASFYRGGTSKAVLFNHDDLPRDQARWDAIFCHIMGSPDAFGRQLDGMGGGVSSLSKVAVVAKSSLPGVDLDYTFVQIAVEQPLADYGAMCGNIASAIGPFAVSSGIIGLPDGPANLTIRNTNTDKLFRANFKLTNGQVVECGNAAIAGVSGTGAEVALTFLNPAGARTGHLLPTHQEMNNLALPSGETLPASLVDVTNPVVFVRAADLGMTGYEHPDALEADAVLMEKLETIRQVGAVAMGLAANTAETAAANPKVAMVAPAAEFQSLDHTTHGRADYDVSVRMASMGRVHRAVTLTAGMCLATSCVMQGTVAPLVNTRHVRIGHPSGILPVSVDFNTKSATPEIHSVTCYRTQRCLMIGQVPIPAHLLDSHHE
nr:PrpF domain-containing protein [Tritonibacter litoralis]